MESINVSDTPVASSCREVHNFNTSQWCAFVTTTNSCKIVDGFIDYTHFMYCGFHKDAVALAMFVLIMWLLFLFVAMAACADDFFCPPLVAIAKVFKMSDNVAGVTLLAFGNGAADVFSSIAAIKTSQDGDIGLAIGALIGAGIFIATVIAGTVCIVTPCHMAERPFLRDVTFFIISVYMVFYILFDKQITLLESIAFLLVYLLYAVVVVFGRWIYQRIKNTSELILPVSSEESNIYDESDSLFDEEETVNDLDDATIGERTPLLSALNVNNHINALQEFLIVLSPVNISEFKRSGWFGKVFMIFRAPAILVLKLAIPVVDFHRPKNGWNRHLNSLHCTLVPLLAVLVVDPSKFNYYVGDKFPIYGFVLIFGIIASVIVFFTSKSNAPPKYHIIFAFLAFGSSVVWTDVIATELVNILTTMGIVINISNAILGLTLLAWGNSVADYIADVVMARKGFPRAALSACYGGPLFNILLGIGLPFTYIVAVNGTNIVNLNLIQIVLVSSLLIILAFTLVLVSTMKFVVGKLFGIFLFFLYFMFLIIVVLVEVGVIKDPF